MKSFIKMLGLLVKWAGILWFALVCLVFIVLLIPSGKPNTAPTNFQPFIDLLFPAFISLAMIVGGKKMVKYVSGEQNGNSKPDFLAFAGKAVLGILLSVVLIIVITIGMVIMRGCNYNNESKKIIVGMSFDEMLSVVSHADDIQLAWVIDDIDNTKPPVEYKYKKQTFERPLRKDGKLAAISYCELEYRIFHFARKFKNITFDANDRIIEIKVKYLD